MKRVRLFLLTFIAIHFVACSQTEDNGMGGTDVTEQFLSEYSGNFKDQSDDSGETITIWRDGDVELLKHRQVGHDNNPAVPNPTHCSFVMSGHIASVIQLNDTARTQTRNDGLTFKSPKTHHLIFTVHNVALSDDLQANSTKNKGCLNFQEQMNQKLPVYTYGMELYGSGTFRLHTHDATNYQGGERTDGTLDEVFVRE